MLLHLMLAFWINVLLLKIRKCWQVYSGIVQMHLKINSLLFPLMFIFFELLEHFQGATLKYTCLSSSHDKLSKIPRCPRILENWWIVNMLSMCLLGCSMVFACKIKVGLEKTGNLGMAVIKCSTFLMCVVSKAACYLFFPPNWRWKPE